MDSKLATIPETDEESENAVPKAQGNLSPVAAMGPPSSPGHPVLRHGGTTRVPPGTALAPSIATRWACYATSRCSTKQ